jgi:hypothetical protein
MASVNERLEKLEQGNTTTQKQDRESKAYWAARKSLRLSPVEGRLPEGIINFITDTLGLDSEIVDDLGTSSYRRVPLRPQDRIKNEVIVQFTSVRDSDIVKAAGFKLAGTNSSMRLELPSHLLGQHRILSKAGADLRKTRPGSRTHIKFDDEALSIVMDYKLKDGDWMRLRPDQAKLAIPASAPKEIKETSSQEFEQLLTPSTPATGANATPVE